MTKDELKNEIKQIKQTQHKEIDTIKIVGLIIGFFAIVFTSFYFIYNTILVSDKNNTLMIVTSFTIMIITILSVINLVLKEQKKKDLMSIIMMLLTIFLITFNFLSSIGVINFY